MKVLFVKLGSIGDIVHTLPALAFLKRQIPAAEVTWVVETKSAEILRKNPLLTSLIEIDIRGLRRRSGFGESFRFSRQQMKDLRAQNFDLAFDFQGLLKSALVARLSGAGKLYGFSKSGLREPASRVFLTEGFEIDRGIHVIEKNLRLVSSALNVDLQSQKIEFPIFTEAIHKEEAAGIISGVGKEFAILNPAGGWVTKLWSAEKYGELADKLWKERGIPSIVTTGPKENDIAQRVLRASKSGKTIQASVSLKGLFELAKKSTIFVGGDTGPTHLAIAAQAPVVGIFGPTEWWRNGSPHRDDICVERLDIGCRIDCHRRTCGNWICMDIGVKSVFEAIQNRLSGSRQAVKS